MSIESKLAIARSHAQGKAIRWFELPEIEQGDYGLCLYQDEEKQTLHVVEYDDDDWWCSHGLDETDPEHNCSRVIGEDALRGYKGCFLDCAALVTGGHGPHVETIPYCSLHVFPFAITPNAFESKREGWVYAVSLMPDIDMRRIKIGFTERPIANRLHSFRTANPTAVLLGLWEADRTGEVDAHHSTDGRVTKKGEVFHVADIFKTIEKLDRLLGCA